MNVVATFRHAWVGIAFGAVACAHDGPGDVELGTSSFAIGGPATSIAVDTAVHAIGRVSETGNGLYRSFQQYDALGRPVAVQHVIDNGSYVYGTTYGYPAGAVAGPGTVTARTTFPDGEVVAYTYDAGGGQQSIKTTPNGGAQQVIVSRVLRNARGQTAEVDFGNGAQQFHVYNDASNLRLNKIYTSFSGTIQQYTYGFDGEGNVTSVTDLNGDSTASYSYDSLDRLTGGTWAYAYDNAGNLTTKEGSVQTYGGTGRGPHALATAGGLTYNYDANGNLISRSDGLTIEWNAENMPIRSYGGAVLPTERFYLNEALLKKVQGGTTTLYLPSMRIENGVPIKYFGNYAERSKDGSLKFYHSDHLGSSTLVTDEAGAVIRRASYKPYGEDRAAPVSLFSTSSGLRFEFNFKEKEQDNSGFYDYGARLYNPATGRFLSADDDLADGLNRYAYVRNNPLRFTDPDGHAARELDANRDKVVTIYVAGMWNEHKVTKDNLRGASALLGGRSFDWVLGNSNGPSDAKNERANRAETLGLLKLIREAEKRGLRVEIVAHSNGVQALERVSRQLDKNSIGKVVLVEPALNDNYRSALRNIGEITTDKTMIMSSSDWALNLMNSSGELRTQLAEAKSRDFKVHDPKIDSHSVRPNAESFLAAQKGQKPPQPKPPVSFPGFYK